MREMSKFESIQEHFEFKIPGKYIFRQFMDTICTDCIGTSQENDFVPALYCICLERVNHFGDLKTVRSPLLRVYWIFNQRRCVFCHLICSHNKRKRDVTELFCPFQQQLKPISNSALQQRQALQHVQECSASHRSKVDYKHTR